MLVSTMTPVEINREIKNDKTVVFQCIQRVFNEYDRERRKFKIAKEKEYIRFYEIKSRKKNNWIFMLNKRQSNKKYSGIDSVALECLTYHYSAKGLQVFSVSQTDDWIHVYNGHFFKRYNERMNLGINNPLDVVKRFFCNNEGSDGIKTPMDGRDFGISVCRDGFQLMEIRDQIKWTVYNTFITRDLAGDDQHQIEDHIIQKIQCELENDLNRKDNLDYIQQTKANLMKDIEAQRKMELDMAIRSLRNQ